MANGGESREALIRKALFAAEGDNVFAVIDGASCPDLLDQLNANRPEFVCLFAGELEPAVAKAAPYLVQLDADSEFASWVLGGWGHHWGVFAVSSADLRAMRKHFRTFLMVRKPDGKPIYFRWYDPRVLRAYLPTCNGEEAEHVFGPISSYILEARDSDTLLQFMPDPERVSLLEIPLTEEEDTGAPEQVAADTME